MTTERPERRKKIFLPRSELALIRNEIERLGSAYSLTPAERARLNELRGITRRDFLRKVGAVAGFGIGLEATRRLFFVDEQHEQPEPITASTKGLDEPRTEKVLEKVELHDGIKQMIEKYNYWITHALTTDLRSGKGLDVFLTLYNEFRKRSRSDNLPELSIADINSTALLLEKIHTLEDIFDQQGYYLKMQPVATPLNDGSRGSTMAIFFGKKVSVTNRSIDTNLSYEHIVIDKEDPAEPVDHYQTLQYVLAAATYQRTPTEPYRVAQFRWTYQALARQEYENGQRRPTVDRDFASQVILSEQFDLTPAAGPAAIMQRQMASSLAHEEQHVKDQWGSDVEQVNMDTNTKYLQKIMGEIRGLLAAVAAADPKMGLLNIYTWKDKNPDDIVGRTAGEQAAGILYDFSGQELLSLCQMRDQQLSQIAQVALRGTDLFWEVAQKQPPATQEELEAVDVQFKELAAQARSKNSY